MENIQKHNTSLVMTPPYKIVASLLIVFAIIVLFI